ncbi:5771_t:CDS:1, partial [Cetraspora pellucida]
HRQYLQPNQHDIISFNIKDSNHEAKLKTKMAQPTFSENITSVLIKYELTENNLIEPKRITRYHPFDKDGYPYCKCNLDELIGTGHTVILVEAGEYDLIERINYFYDNDDKEPGFRVFGDIIGYTSIKFDTRGEKANGISFVFKHASEWNNAMNRKDISQSVNMKLINV